MKRVPLINFEKTGKKRHMSRYQQLKFLWIWLLLAGPLSARIIEAPHFQDITSHIDANTLILLDIDDTLIVSKQMLGSDPWFEHRWKSYRDEGLSLSDALEKSVAEWVIMCHLTQTEIVEPGTETLIQKLQREGNLVMGLTSRDFSLATRTRTQLREHHIDLSHSAPCPKDHYTCIDGHGVLYRHGILYTSGRCKGEALFKICEQMGFTPKRILFINDKLSHLQDIEKSAQEKGVEFIGLRYGYTDPRKAAFRPEIADVQWKCSNLGKILSDEEASAN